MAIGDFTKENADVVGETAEDMFKGVPKRKQMDYIGHLNEILCFVEAAKKAAPAQQ